MKRLLSILFIVIMLVSCIVTSSAYSWDHSYILTVDEGVKEYELRTGKEVETNRYYFLMPNGTNGDISSLGEFAPTWYTLREDGSNATYTPAIYWWGDDVAAPDFWVGYLPSGVDAEDTNVFFADVPKDVTQFIWNNGVDSGVDPADPNYFCAVQSINIPCEYYDPGESIYYPNGTENFSNMIFVINPDKIKINSSSSMQTCGGEWFYYYGKGCYGFTPDGDKKYCIRGDHNHSESDLIELPTEKPTECPEEQEINKLYFEPDTAGWNKYKKIYCHIMDYETGESIYNWQSKYESCSDNKDGRWYYDLSAKGVELIPEKMYSCIFSNENGMQSYSLLFDSTCLGDSAYCDGTKYESPNDHSKTCMPAFWRNQDKEKFGPEKCITSTGNVIGTCMPSEANTSVMLENFLSNFLTIARANSGKSDQQLLDDIGVEFEFTANIIEEAIAKTGVTVKWSIEKSKLPQTLASMPEVDRTKLEYKLCVDADSIWGSQGDSFYCHIYSEYKDITFYSKGDKREACVKNEDGTWTYDLKANGIELQPDIVYQVQFYSALPTASIISPVNINNTYLDYTLYYDFAEQDYKWEYRGKATENLLGDADGDGKVSIMDATTIQRHIAQLDNITDGRLACADTDKNGKVSVIDATMIQRFIAQLIPSL